MIYRSVKSLLIDVITAVIKLHTQLPITPNKRHLTFHHMQQEIVEKSSQLGTVDQFVVVRNVCA